MKRMMVLALFALSACSGATKFHGGNVAGSAAGPDLSTQGEIWRAEQQHIEAFVAPEAPRAL